MPGSMNVLERDDITNAKVVMDYEHHDVHDGSMFHANVNSASLGVDANINIGFYTTDTVGLWNHVSFNFNGSGEVLFEILEGPTVTLGTGSDFVPRNHNRNSTKTSTVKSLKNTPVVNELSLNSTITADGTVLRQVRLGGGQIRQAESRGEKEWILKENTLYVFRLTSKAAANVCQLTVDWYEHQNKNM